MSWSCEFNLIYLLNFNLFKLFMLSILLAASNHPIHVFLAKEHVHAVFPKYFSSIMDYKQL